MGAALDGFRAGVVLQLHLLWNRMPDSLFPLITAPFFTITFLAIVGNADRPDLNDYAILAPVLISVWWLCLFEAGGMIFADRWLGTLEAQVPTPASFPAIILGRILVVTLTGLLSFAEVLVVARLVFGITLDVYHPGAFAATLVATGFAMAGTGVVMAALFVMARNSVTFANSLSYPVYVLGGVLVPVSFLPDWIEPIAAAVFLSWSADLLRASVDSDPISDFEFRLIIILVLGGVGYAVGGLLIERLLRKARSQGTLEQA
ncbi:MAG: ABC transporter permease [Actinomycetota bacterium]|nr:ABC transporter permease [Actinomycetota bacterium]